MKLRSICGSLRASPDRSPSLVPRSVRSICGLTALITLAPLSAALACSPPPDWQSAGFGVLDHLWSDAATLPHGRFIPLQSPGDNTPDFAVFSQVLQVELLDAEGVAVPGHLTSTPLPGTALWIPQQPLAGAGPWQLTTRTPTSWGEERTNTIEITLVPQPEIPTALSLALSASKFDFTVFGDCISVTQDSCGELCEESEVLRTEARFELWADVGFGAGTEGRVDTIRGALGTTPGEAQAVLERTAFQRASGPLRIEGAPYATWPHPKACAAVEVRSLEGEVLLLDTRCTDLPEDDALGRTIEERLDGENTPDAPARNTGGGCRTSPTGPAWWSLALLGLLRRRRSVKSAV